MVWQLRSRRVQDDNEDLPRKKTRLDQNEDFSIHLAEPCPARIQKLKLSVNEMHINNIKYRVYTAQGCNHWAQERTIVAICSRREDVGLRYDLDHYCLPELAENLTPGDILFESPLEDLKEKREGLIEERMMYLEDIRHDLRESRPGPKDEKLRKEVRLGKEWMRCFRWNRELEKPCQRYVELAINEEKAQSFQPGIKIHQVMKKLAQITLGDQPTLVEKLIIDKSPKILRLPEGLKLKVKKLLVPDECIPGIMQIIDPSSLPLEQIVVPWHDLTKHEVVMTAKELIITSGSEPGPFSFEKIESQKIRFSTYYIDFKIEDYVRIAKDLMEKPVGTHYQFTMRNRDLEILERIGKELPINSKLSVLFEELPGKKSGNYDEFEDKRARLVLNMKVVEIEGNK